MDTKKVNKRVLYGVLVFVILVFGIIAFKAYKDYNRTFFCNFSGGSMTIVGKERARGDDGEEIFWLTIKHEILGKEYIFHVALSESIEEPYLLFDALFVNAEYNTVAYEYEIPRRIAIQELGFKGGPDDYYKLIENDEMIEKYMRVSYIGAD